MQDEQRKECFFSTCGIHVYLIVVPKMCFWFCCIFTRNHRNTEVNTIVHIQHHHTPTSMYTEKWLIKTYICTH